MNTNSRKYHIVGALYHLTIFVTGFIGLLYLVSNHLENPVNIAIAGMAFGLWFKEHFLGYARHAGGVLSPHMARNTEKQ